MEEVSQMFCGHEISIDVDDVNIGEHYYTFPKDGKIHVFKKKKDNKSSLIKIVDNYGELGEIEGLNVESNIRDNFILLNT